MSGYTDMQARIADELTRSDLTSQIQLAILSAVQHYERERWYFQETSTTFSTTAPVAGVGTQAYNLPTDFKSMELLRLTYNATTYWEITYQDFDYINSITSTSNSFGPPQKYAIYGQQLVFYPIPDAVYTVTEYYTQQLTALSSNGNNAWMVDGEQLIRARAKWDVITNSIRTDPDGAGEQKQIEQEAYQSLRGSSTSRTVMGRLRPNYL